MDCDVCNDGYCPSCDTNFSKEIVRLEQKYSVHDRLCHAEIERVTRERDSMRRERDVERRDAWKRGYNRGLEDATRSEKGE